MSAIKSLQHDIRNWLHQLLSSVEAAMPDLTALCFSQHQPIEVVTPFPEYSFTEWQVLADTLEAALGHLRPGAIRYKMKESISVLSETPDIRVQWDVVFTVKADPGNPIVLRCVALLIEEEGDLVATTLHCSPIVEVVVEPPVESQSE